MPRNPNSGPRTDRSAAHVNQTYRTFIRDLCADGEMAEELAEQAAPVVLQALQERILGDQARHLLAQLPRKLQKSLVVSAGASPATSFDAEALFARVADQLGMQADEVEPIVRAVLSVVSRHVAEGEIIKVMGQLPRDIRELFPREMIAASIEHQHEAAARIGPAVHRIRSAPHLARDHAAELVEEILELPLEAQLGIIRSLVPRVLVRMDADARDSYWRDLDGEIDWAEHGGEPYDISPRTPLQ